MSSEEATNLNAVDPEQTEPQIAAGLVSRPSRLADEVYARILDRLMSLEIAPDQRIGVDQLARELGVSQTPVREALSQLEAQGLVLKTHLLGYRAAPQLTRKQFDDLSELRLLIEPVAAAKAAAAMDEAAHGVLRELTETMQHPATERTAYSAFARQDARFHGFIAAQSGNELIHQLIAQSRTQLHLFRLRFMAQVTLEAVREHALIVQAIEAREPDAAAAAMRDHIEQAHLRFRKVYD